MMPKTRMTPPCPALVCVLAWSTFLGVAVAEDRNAYERFVWVEGESLVDGPATSHPWYNDVRREDLSGGDWFSHFDDGDEGFARYSFEVEEAATYTFWLRANPVNSRLSYSMDGSGWRSVPVERSEGPVINLAADDQADLRFVAWLNLGPIELDAGTHEIVFRLHSDSHHHGGIDCFCLVLGDWRPSGILKPGERLPFWPAPELGDDNLARWVEFIRPSPDELSWQKVRWHGSLSAAAEEARELGRPVLLWTMNGHPCGET